jgi:hypothetical protein
MYSQKILNAHLIKSLKGNFVQLSAGKIAVEAIFAKELCMDRREVN